ncbi:predicted protein [Histoplasma mississippiense (nom. inval.)]|uniref:predicted protein n=1 Tax=Ajellomyces capsulatus (strain NAm1 / WU24) TaxID=2059318 RepID=UPI000157D3ED|nr:predicted protein [Histoplasma mississippiense (nom. inval.)]EDN04824.1 predicted protein [Histoplasma mississippiense (nom. inval.)]
MGRRQAVAGELMSATIERGTNRLEKEKGKGKGRKKRVQESKEQWKQVNKYHIIGKRTRGEILRMKEELAGA